MIMAGRKNRCCQSIDKWLVVFCVIVIVIVIIVIVIIVII